MFNSTRTRRYPYGKILILRLLRLKIRIAMAQLLRATNLTRATVLCARLEDAGGMAGRGRGLLGRDHLEPDQGMLFVAGRLSPFMWMHMFFMRFAIDIVFLDGADTVIRIDHQLKPWRISSLVFGARKALELAAGAAERSRTQEGDRVQFESAK